MLYVTFILIAIYAAFTLAFAVTSLREGERRAGMLGLLAAAVLLVGLGGYAWAWRAWLLSDGAGYVIVTVVGIVLSVATLACFLPLGRNRKALAGTKGMIESTPEQFNQKDTPFNKAHVGAFGPEITKRRWAFHDLSPFGGTFWAILLGLRQQVDGKPAERRQDLPPGQAARQVKQTARYLGADLVGITTLKSDFTYSEGFSYEQSKLAVGPAVTATIETGHTHIIMLAKEMSHRHIRATLTDRNDLSDGEIGRTYAELGQIACALATYIRQLGFSARAHHVRNEQVFMVPHAIDAGLGEQGRLNYVITKEFGPRVRMAAVTTDMPLAEDKPVDIGVQDFCDHCRICQTNCPAQALAEERTVVRGYRKWPQDNEKCFLFWYSGGNTHACTLCLKVCPWNKPRALVHRVAFLAAARSVVARRALYWITILFYGRKLRWRRLPLPEGVELPPETKGWAR